MAVPPRVARPSRARRGLVLLVALGCLGVTFDSCGSGGGPDRAAAPPGPTSPYDQLPASQSFGALPVDPVGEAGQMTAGLTGIGFFCAQVRASDEVRQIWCQRYEDRLRDAVADPVTTVDIISTPSGRVGYLRTTQPDLSGSPLRSGDQQADADLRAILEVSVLQTWPDDRDKVDEVLGGARAHEDFFIGSSLADPRRPSRARAESPHAQYFAGEGTRFGGAHVEVSGLPPLTFVLATDELPNSPWPTGSSYALQTPAEAAPGLEAGGFDCYGPDESPCTRPEGNQQLDYTTPPGQPASALTARVGIGGGARLDGAMTTFADWGFPEGLTFLNEQVRDPVEARIQQARSDGLSFTGVVAGVVLVIQAEPIPGGQPNEAAYVTVTIGAPLVTGLS